MKFVTIFGQLYPTWEGGVSVLFNGEVCWIFTDERDEQFITTSNGSKLYIDRVQD